MKIAVWKTGHEIADKIADALNEGLREHSAVSGEEADAGIGYGILRGMADKFRSLDATGKPWFNVDRGYWKPGHYDGYYRISLNGTQQTTGLDKLEPDYDRWDALGLSIETRPRHDPQGRILICPPTDAVTQFFQLQNIHIKPDPKLIIRRKDSVESLQKDLDKCCMVRTFNSSVGWEALRQGIPVVSDKSHSFVGAYQNQVDKMSQLTIDGRRRMFAVQSSLQLSLEEIKSGKIWPLILRLLEACKSS